MIGGRARNRAHDLPHHFQSFCSTYQVFLSYGINHRTVALRKQCTKAGTGLAWIGTDGNQPDRHMPVKPATPSVTIGSNAYSGKQSILVSASVKNQVAHVGAGNEQQKSHTTEQRH